MKALAKLERELRAKEQAAHKAWLEAEQAHAEVIWAMKALCPELLPSC